MNNNESLNEDTIVDEPSSSINAPQTKNINQKGVPKPVTESTVKSGGDSFSPKNTVVNKNDVARLQQALSKKNEPLSNQQNNQDDNNQTKTEQQGPKNEGLIDRGAKQAITAAGGTAITAASGGIIPKPIADMFASKLSGPALKMIKFQIIMFSLPILLLIIVIIPVIIAGYNAGSNSSSEGSNLALGGSCSYKVGGNEVSNVKVRLMYCDGKGAITSEELIDFEDYIVGVVYQENGGASYEALKIQAVVARSFSLTRPKIMGNSLGTSLKQENGQWILSLRSCTNDQVFCNPNKGCWSNVNGGQTSNSNPGGWRNCTVYSGYDKSKHWTRPPLAEDSKIRKAVEETRGQVAINKQGGIAYTDFTDTTQTQWNNLAKEGKDYFEILKKTYSNVVSLSSNCTSGDSNNSNTGEFANWKQCDNRWGKNKLGNSSTTICDAGCAATSVSIQLARSGASLIFKDLNPGTFVKEYNKVGGFEKDLIVWSNVNKVASNFKYISKDTISGSTSKKAKKLQEYLNNGEYVVIGVYKTAKADKVGHWVALDKVEGDTVYINDPGQSNMGNKLFDIYKYTKSRNITVVRYKKG